MGDRGRQLAHRRDAVGVRELHQGLAVAPLAFASLGFRPLALGQIKHERDTLVSLFVKRGRADQHRQAAAVLAEILLFKGLHVPFAFSSATVRASRARHSVGVRSVMWTRAETRSSRSYPTMCRNASLASMI